MLGKDKTSQLKSFVIKTLESITRIVYPKDPKQLQTALLGKEDENSKLFLSTKHAILSLPYRSLQRRALLAVVCNSYGTQFIQDDFAVMRTAQATCRKDFALIQDGHELAYSEIKAIRYKWQVVNAAVDYILSKENIQLVSWGARTLQLNGQDVLTPKIIQKVVAENTLTGYQFESLLKEEQKAMHH